MLVLAVKMVILRLLAVLGSWLKNSPSWNGWSKSRWSIHSPAMALSSMALEIIKCIAEDGAIIMSLLVTYQANSVLL